MFREYNYNDLDAICLELRNNKVGVIKTDTIIGLISLNPSMIYKIKRRPWYKKVVKFLPSPQYISNLFGLQKTFINKFWPGPVTIIKAKTSYRIPNDDFLLALMSMVGPLYCSSANISNKEVIKTLEEANYHFSNKFFFDLFIINTNTKPSNEQSTIINIDNWKVVRKGCLYNEINEWLSKYSQKVNKK